jgi:hypothetical protein
MFPGTKTKTNFPVFERPLTHSWGLIGDFGRFTSFQWVTVLFVLEMANVCGGLVEFISGIVEFLCAVRTSRLEMATFIRAT